LIVGCSSISGLEGFPAIILDSHTDLEVREALILKVIGQGRRRERLRLLLGLPFLDRSIDQVLDTLHREVARHLAPEDLIGPQYRTEIRHILYRSYAFDPLTYLCDAKEVVLLELAHGSTE
jgi:hypothetical protein